MRWITAVCTTMNANITEWPIYMIPKGRKTTCFRLPYEIITTCSLPAFISNSIFQNCMSTNTVFVLTSLAGWLAASSAELCHESRRQVLLPRRIFCTRRLLLLLQAASKISSQLQAGRKCVSQPQRTTVAFLILVALLCEQASHPSFHRSESCSQPRIYSFFQLDAVWESE